VRRVVDRAETSDGVTAGQELGRWTSDLLDVIEISFLHWHVVRPDLATGRIQPSH
jgi:hypothetical protein